MLTANTKLKWINYSARHLEYNIQMMESGTRIKMGRMIRHRISVQVISSSWKPPKLPASKIVNFVSPQHITLCQKVRFHSVWKKVLFSYLINVNSYQISPRKSSILFQIENWGHDRLTLSGLDIFIMNIMTRKQTQNAAGQSSTIVTSMNIDIHNIWRRCLLLRRCQSPIIKDPCRQESHVEEERLCFNIC